MRLKLECKSALIYLFIVIGVVAMCACDRVKERQYYEIPAAESANCTNLIWEGKSNYAIIYRKRRCGIGENGGKRAAEISKENIRRPSFGCQTMLRSRRGPGRF